MEMQTHAHSSVDKRSDKGGTATGEPVTDPWSGPARGLDPRRGSTRGNVITAPFPARYAVACSRAIHAIHSWTPCTVRPCNHHDS
jgi:hypothetical protein